MATTRPNPVLWLYYQYGGKLPETYRGWVLHDATCRTWLARVVLRGLVQIVPIAAVLFTVFLYFGGAWAPAMGAGILGLLVVVRITLTSSVESVDGRLVTYGFPPGHASAVRAREDEAAAARYRATWRRTEE